MNLTTAASQEEALNELMNSLGTDDTDILIGDEFSSPDAVLAQQQAALAGPSAVDVASEPKVSLEPEGEPQSEAVPPVEAKAKKKAAPKAPRKHYANKVDRLKDKIGSDLGNYTVLEVADGALTGAALADKQAETIKAIQAAGSKVQNRVTFILEFMAGKSAKLNGVIEKAFRLLKTDGSIVSGDSGNLQAVLVGDGKTLASARAMSNNTIAALRTLKVVDKTDDGKYVPNAQSLVLMKVGSMLGL